MNTLRVIRTRALVHDTSNTWRAGRSSLRATSVVCVVVCVLCGNSSGCVALDGASARRDVFFVSSFCCSRCVALVVSRLHDDSEGSRFTFRWRRFSVCRAPPESFLKPPPAGRGNNIVCASPLHTATQPHDANVQSYVYACCYTTYDSCQRFFRALFIGLLWWCGALSDDFFNIRIDFLWPADAAGGDTNARQLIQGQ